MADEKKGGALAAWVSKNGAVVSKQARAAALARVADERGSAGGGDVEYLTFSGMGKNYKGWTIGRDKRTPDPDALYVVDPDSIFMGYTCWISGKPKKKHKWGMYEIDRSMSWDDLDHSLATGASEGDGWKEMIGFALFDIDDPEKRIEFETTSASGVNSVRDLLDLIREQSEADEPSVPVIRLDDGIFEAQGKPNGKPLFPVDTWVTEEEVHAFLQAGDDRDAETFLNGGYAVEEEEEEAAPPADPEPPQRRARRRAA